MFCPKCGKPNADDAAFCAGCGNKLNAAKAAAGAAGAIAKKHTSKRRYEQDIKTLRAPVVCESVD